MNRPRKDYGCPLRLYKFTDGHWLAIPPRSADSLGRFKVAGRIASIQLDASARVHHVMASPAARKDRQRVAWDEVPAHVQRALRATFLGCYCPKETT